MIGGTFFTIAAVKGVELAVFVLMFGVVTVLGFVAARWRAGHPWTIWTSGGWADDEFGSWITWFLIGGDLYTAYTFVAVPALLFGVGAAGWFALPYTEIDRLPAGALAVPAVVGVPRTRVRDTRRFRPGSHGSPILGAGDRDHRNRGDHALHRPATGRVGAVLRTMGFNGSGWPGTRRCSWRS